LEEIMPEQIVFKNRSAFRRWLEKNHAQPEGIWLVFGKNNLLTTLSPDQALEEALCFGWIDGLIKSVDETQYIKFFSPRRTKSKWSERNKKIAQGLIKNGQMASPGMQAIEKAKKNGCWENQNSVEVTQQDIDLFASSIAVNLLAAANFHKMSLSVKKQFAGFYREAKREDTRQRRLEKLIGLLEQNKRPM
jgi:uncharacterized protein YdeI (YjbR/CyaY-like superfamily)